MVFWNKQLKPKVVRRIRKLPHPTAKVMALAEIWQILNSGKVEFFH